jgi:hypothetical protein
MRKQMTFFWFFSFSFLLFFNSYILSSNENDECSILLSKLKSEYVEYRLGEDLSAQTNFIEEDYLSTSFTGGIFFKRDFDEQYSKTEYRSFFRNESDNIIIEAISPNLFNEFSEFYEWVDDSPLYNFKARDLSNVEVTYIDNIQVSNLSDDEIIDLIYDSTLILKPIEFIVNDNSGIIRKFELDFGQYLQNRVSVPIEIEDIYDVDSLNSSFTSRHTETYVWWQYGTNKIGHEILEQINLNITNPENKFIRFQCSFDFKQIEELGIYIPDIRLSNLISEEVLKDKIIFTYSDEEVDYRQYTKSYWLRTTEKVATIKTKFNYQSFPFDMQIIRFGFEPLNSIDVIPYLHYDSPLEWSKSRISLDNWKTSSYSINNYIFQGSQGFDRVGLEVVFKLERNTLYYLLKIYLPLLIVLMVSLSVLYIKPTELESRLTVSVVCFLALITYTYIVDQDIPKLSYLTVMDYVILVSYFFSALPTLQSIYVHSISTKSIQKAIIVNNRFKILMPLFYFLTILIITFTIVSSGSNTISALRFTT